MKTVRKLTIEVLSPSTEQLTDIAREAIHIAQRSPDAIIEVSITKEEEAE